jgi:hypothetical protein
MIGASVLRTTTPSPSKIPCRMAYAVRNAAHVGLCPRSKHIIVRSAPCQDSSYTYDGRLIMSARAVDKLGLRNRPEETQLVELDHEPSVFYALPTRVIAFDPVARQTRFEKSCARCGGFESVVGSNACLSERQRPPRTWILQNGSGLRKRSG